MKRRLHDILAEVAGRHAVPIVDMRGRRRLPRIVLARQEFYYLALVQTEHTMWKIGSVLGYDNTTVMHGAAQHARRNDLPAPRGCNYDAWQRWRPWREWPTYQRRA